MNEHLVVFDTDMGTDDAWAFLMLLKAETVLNLFTILAITAVHGNTKVTNVTENAFRLLSSVGRTDIPIYRGAPKSLIPIENNEAFYGLDGFGDVVLSNPNCEEYSEAEHAVNAMYQFVMKYPKRVSFVSAGPLSNLALCITMYNEFLENVKDIWILGGKLNNTDGKVAEFNFRVDAVATHIVVNTTKVPIHIVPVEPCFEANQGIGLDFRFNYLGSVHSPPINLLNKVEAPIFVPKNNWEVFDPMMTAAFIFPRVIVASGNYHGFVEPYGPKAGVMTLSRTGDTNVHVIEKLDRDYYRMMIAWTAGVKNACFVRPYS